MIPRGFIYKNMFLFLMYFLNGKLILWVFIFYVATAFYYQINDGKFIVNFIAILFFLLVMRLSLQDSLKKEIYRYKKYLVLKRKRASRIKVANK